jgi:hypothetical protein
MQGMASFFMAWYHDAADWIADMRIVAAIGKSLTRAEPVKPTC